MQSQYWLLQSNGLHQWLTKNIDSAKTAAIIELQEQMVETKVWKEIRGIGDGVSLCRLCGMFQKTVAHWQVVARR